MVLNEFLDSWKQSGNRLLVHTSGSTGTPKPMWVEKCRMMESARITCDFLGLQSGDTALLCMSLDYIAGKMMVVRSLIRNLRLINVKPSGHPLSDVIESITFAAMVPMQVYNSLKVPMEKERLKNIKHLIIGGGPIDGSLEKELKEFPNNVWSTYGMTETLSHIALRKLNGADADEWYTPLDHVEVSVNDSSCLVINAPRVCGDVLVTHDIAELNPDGRRFRILGRKDNVIVTGGVKVHIEEVEEVLRKFLSYPFLITKKKDRKFGEVVGLMLVKERCDVEVVQSICKKKLPKYWQPKFFMQVYELPMTKNGKPARAVAEKMAENYQPSL